MFPRSNERRLTASQRAELVRRSEARFRYALAHDAIDAAERLQRAYRGVLKATDTRLKEVKGDRLLTPAGTQRLVDGIRAELDGLTAEIEAQARRLQDGAIKTGLAMGAEALDTAGVLFGRPAVESVQALVNYVDSSAFQQRLQQYGDTYANEVADTILAMAAQGKDPAKIARAVTRLMRGQPLNDAQRMVRTVQLYAARRGQQAIFQKNSDVVLGWVWSSARDKRTCFGCLAKHGSKHPITEVLNDHHLGRCAMVPMTPSWADLGFEDGTDLPVIETGEAWFRAQPEAEQRQQMGPALWMAYRDGAFTFDQLAQPYQNDVYGEMIGEASLTELIGEAAAREYVRQARTATVVSRPTISTPSQPAYVTVKVQ